MKKGLIIPLALMIYASPAKAEEFTLPLPLNENTIETIHSIRIKETRSNSYGFSFYSASKRGDNKFIVVWGFDIYARSNIENYVETFKELENNYQTAISAYDSLKTDISDFIGKVDALESKLNDSSFTEKAENAKNFVNNWNNQLPLNLDYSYEKNDIEQFAKFVNTAKNINTAYENFKELSDFITEENNGADNETKTLANAANESRANLESTWSKMADSTDAIYSRVTDKNLELPFTYTGCKFFINLIFPFYGKWMMGTKD